MKKHQDIVKSNVMINSYLAGDLTLTSTRLIYACLLQIKSKTDVFDHKRLFVIKGNELADITGRKSKDGYKSLIKAVKENLAQSGFNTKYDVTGQSLFPSDPDDYRYIGIINTIDYRKGSGEVHITFTPAVIPYVTELKGNFTKMMAHHIIPMKSKYGMRLYELCMSWMGTEREFTIEEFRKLFGVENKYKTLKNLKARVLNPALKDIQNHTDLKVQFGQVKSGREVVAFQFAITKRATRSPRISIPTIEEWLNNNPIVSSSLSMKEAIKKYSKDYKAYVASLKGEAPDQERVKDQEEEQQLSLLDSSDVRESVLAEAEKILNDL